MILTDPFMHTLCFQHAAKAVFLLLFLTVWTVCFRWEFADYWRYCFRWYFRFRCRYHHRPDTSHVSFPQTGIHLILRTDRMDPPAAALFKNINTANSRYFKFNFKIDDCPYLSPALMTVLWPRHHRFDDIRIEYLQMLDLLFPTLCWKIDPGVSDEFLVIGFKERRGWKWCFWQLIGNFYYFPDLPIRNKVSAVGSKTL